MNVARIFGSVTAVNSLSIYANSILNDSSTSSNSYESVMIYDVESRVLRYDRISYNNPIIFYLAT